MSRWLFLTLAITWLLAGCGYEWKPLDGDGDGISAAEGDCWDQPDGPEGSGLTGADIHPGVAETWYDGIDQDCAGDDDFDADGDGLPIDRDCDDQDPTDDCDAPKGRPKACGCSSTRGAPAPALVLALALLSRRRPQHHPRTSA